MTLGGGGCERTLESLETLGVGRRPCHPPYIYTNIHTFLKQRSVKQLGLDL